METRFPSNSWFQSKKPTQTKKNYDHTTGLCKDCHMNHQNYDTLVKEARTKCKCKTNMCQNWTCLCGEEETCECDPICSCDDCETCQVNMYGI